VNERADWSRIAIWTAFAALIAAANFAAYDASGSTTVPENALFRWSTAVGTSIFTAVWIAISLTISGGRPGLRALRRSQISFPTFLGLSLLVIFATYVATVVVSTFGANPAREQGLLTEHWQPGHGAAFAANAVTLVVLAPLSEELFARGLGFGLFSPFGRGVAIVVPAVVWALMHGLLEAVFPLSVLGIGLAYLRARSSSIIPGMLVHGFFNGLALAVAFGL
jgi:membrane protease YdiL (CAAX protease family)